MKIVHQREQTPNETVLQRALDEVRENNRKVINEIRIKGATPRRKQDLKNGLQFLSELNQLVAGGS